MYYRLYGCLLFSLMLISAAPSFAKTSKLVGTKLAFEQFELVVPFDVKLPVITLDILINEQFSADELVIIGEDENKQTWLAVYALDNKVKTFTLLDKMKLAGKYFAFDVSENQQGLYFLAKNEVVNLKYNDVVAPEGVAKPGLYFEQIESINSIFMLNQSSFITRKNFIQDVNKDGFDDIVLPDFEQTNLWLDLKHSKEYFYQALPIISQAELNRGSVSFSPTRLFFADFNHDDLQDIAWVSKGQINYFSQLVEGRFSNQQKRLPLRNSISGLDWWQIRESDGESLDQSDLTHRVIEKIQDINGDGIVDVVVRFTQSSGVLDRSNDYEFYFGYLNTNKQLEYAKTPSTVIKAEGTLTGLKIVDVNKDSKFEVLLSSFELSVSNIIGALLSGGIDQNVLLFGLNDNNVYEEDALINKEVELNFSLSSGQSGQPIVLLTDVNGDELDDLLLSSGKNRLKIFLGQQGSKLFNRKASKHKLSLPKNGSLFEHYDINHDGKEDFIMRYGRLDDESMANKVTILVVK